MDRNQVIPREDGPGPYRWNHVVKNGHGGRPQGSIYRKTGDELSAYDIARLVALCDGAGFDMRRTALMMQIPAAHYLDIDRCPPANTNTKANKMVSKTIIASETGKAFKAA